MERATHALDAVIRVAEHAPIEPGEVVQHPAGADALHGANEITEATF